MCVAIEAIECGEGQQESTRKILRRSLNELLEIFSVFYGADFAIKSITFVGLGRYTQSTSTEGVEA